MRSRVVLLSSGLAAAMLLAACGGGSESGDAGGSGAAPSEISVAVAGPTTGDNAVYGNEQLRGIQLAAEAFTAAGGPKVKVVSFDDAADPNQGASVAQKICDDTSLIAAFGHSNSSVTLAAMPIYQRCGIPLVVSYSSNPKITATLTSNVFRALPDDNALGGEQAILGKQVGMTKVGILTSPDDYGAGVTAAFQKTAGEIGMTVAKQITTSPNQKDFTPQLTDLKNAGADGLALANTYTDAALQIKQARAMGWTVPIIVTAGSNTPELINIGGKDATEGTYIAAVFDPGSTTPGVAAFNKAYTAKFGGSSGTEAAAMAYNSFEIFAAAWKAGGTDREGVISKAASIKTFEFPITGKTTLNANQGIDPDPSDPFSVLLQVKGGVIASGS